MVCTPFGSETMECDYADGFDLVELEIKKKPIKAVDKSGLSSIPAVCKQKARRKRYI